MIIFIYGSDTYRSRQKLEEIIRQYQEVRQSGLNFKIYDLSSPSISFQDFKDEFQQISMFKEKKLTVLKNVFSNQKFKEEVLKEKKLLLAAEDIIVFFEEDKVLESDKLTKFLKKNAKWQKFELLKGRELEDWLKKEFSAAGVIFERGVLEKLIEFVGNDTWRLINEVRKLASYKKNKAVSLEDLRLLIKPKIETAIFKTIEAIARQQKKLALKLIEEHLEKGDSPLYLLSMVIYQFRNLLLIKSKYDRPYGQKSAEKDGLKLHPYVIKKTTELARNFSLEELKKIYNRIFQLDLEIKTGQIKPEEGLRMLIAEI